jgi:serine/threonine protein kinase HipA of HipAB toxin-antitoxin module
MPQIQLGPVQLGEMCTRAAETVQKSITALEAILPEAGTAMGQALSRLKEAQITVERLHHIVKMSHVPAGSRMEAIILSEDEVEALRAAIFDRHEA